MLSFLFSYIFSLKSRNVAIIFTMVLLFFVSAFFFSLYQNTLGAIRYYSPNTIDPHRVTFSSEGSVFDIFSKNGGGIDQIYSDQIQKDQLFSRVRMFRFVDTNIIGGFDIFTFHFDTDIPVFTLEDTLSEMKGFGISPAMMHYYNLELAGSHPMFPPLDEQFLRGKSVTLTFGASKIFSINTASSSPLHSTITSIDSDYPGFGIVAPKSLVDEKLHEIGAAVKQPYKIIAYMRDRESRDEIVKKYSTFHLKFDIDREKEYDRQLSVVDLTLFGTGIFFLGIILFLIGVLFFGYFRGKKDIFRLVEVYGIRSQYRYILLYGEVIVFMIIALLGSLLLIYVFQSFFLLRVQGFFTGHGVLFPLIYLSFFDIGKILFTGVMVIFCIIVFASRK